MRSDTWFEVDKAGLGALVEGRDKAHIIAELVQNAWDEASKMVALSIESSDDRGIATIVVSDDNPEGFADLRDAYTMFKASRKKASPTLRGRFNVGEKIFLALCRDAEIATTTGTVRFSEDGSRTMSRRSVTTTGTIVRASLRMTKPEVLEAVAGLRRLIPPAGIITTINGEVLEMREPSRRFSVALPTVIGDSEGVLRAAIRTTEVAMHEPRDLETPMIYELGIPVVESDMPWHLDVQQKVPLTNDRDNVPLRFRRILVTAALNETHLSISSDQATGTWASIAIESPDVEPEAFTSVFKARFGDLAVSYDPSDLEANSRAVAEGFRVVHGGNLSGQAWENARRFEAIKPAGQVFPTHPLDGTPIDSHIIPKAEWSEEMRRFAAFANRMGSRVAQRAVTTVFYNAIPNASATMASGSATLSISMKCCTEIVNGYRDTMRAEAYDLLIHEFSHLRVANHLSEDYYKELTRLGGLMVDLAIREPEQFEVEAANERTILK